MRNQAAGFRRRRFLIAATTAVGGVAAVGVATPFVMSMMPSQKARAAGAPVEIDIGGIEPGTLVTFEWRREPIWVVFRTPEMLDLLGKHYDKLLDPQSEQPQQPEYTRNATRSITPRYFVAIGICTHLGCIPTYRKEGGAADLGAAWPGGFFCPCHGSKFDLAGRVFRGVPAPSSLVIPPHRYVTDTRVVIGEDTRKSDARPL